VETEDIRGIIKRRFGGDVVLVTDGWFTDLEAR
jgi:hypothetical protein